MANSRSQPGAAGQANIPHGIIVTRGDAIPMEAWPADEPGPRLLGRGGLQYMRPATEGPLAGIVYWRDPDKFWRNYHRLGDEPYAGWTKSTLEEAMQPGGVLEPDDDGALPDPEAMRLDSDYDYWERIFDLLEEVEALKAEWEKEPMLPPPATPLEFAKRQIAEGKADGLYAANLMNRVAGAVEQALQGPPPPGWEKLAQSVIDAKKPALVMLSGDQIAPRVVEWIWKHWLAKGKFHLLAGKPGIGKSTLVFSLLAAITRGGPFPDGSRCEPAYVVIWSNEDDVADTIVPRLIAAGADMSMVKFPDGVVRPSYSGGHVPKVNGTDSEAFHPARHMADLTAAVQALQEEGKPVGAVMVDPVVAMFQAAGRGASNNAAETRDALQPLADFAGATGVAVIGVTHFTKGTDGQDPLERVSGSGAFAALARIVWCAAQGEEGPARLVRVKSNVGPTGDGYEYTLEQPEGGQIVQWGRLLHGYARTLLEEIAPAPIKRGEKLEHATSWLMGQLYAAGDAGVPMSHLKAAAAAHGILWRTVENARAKLGQSVETITGATAGPGGRPEYRWRRRPEQPAPMTEGPLPWE